MTEGPLRASPSSVLIMVMLMAVPLITTVYLSFNRIFLRDLNDRQWIGFENYTEVLSDPAFWDAFNSRSSSSPL